MSAINTEVSDGVATLTLDRPPVNAVRFEDMTEMLEAFRSVQDRDDVRAVVFTGAGDRAFVAGTDLQELASLTAETAAESVMIVQDLVNLIYSFPVPVISAVNGPALGSGVAIACASDIRIASTKASFILPEVNIGVMGGSAHVARFLPQGRARWMMYTGEPVSCEEAYRFGMVDKVVEPADLMAEARELALKIASKYPPAIRLAKAGLNGSEWLDLQAGYAYECELTVELRRDPGSAEVSRAFLEARTKR
ncbi:MAG: enoyl-CoA hydratase [Actinobacteria bacterium]|uniref:Unannotated protein n=1 Tax=freshwater metagenome TaxID=449393 RepID=A0A6J7KXW0_9ZZZZ|nr:enoyl-CoA hydratase [Actinomycetota bacterium]